MRIALYARVSTQQQEVRGTIGSQIEALRARAHRDEHEVVQEYIDDGHSGATLDRPGLDALRDAAERGLVEAVLCLCPDRLARSYAYQVLVIDELARHNVKVLFADAPPLQDDPQAQLLTQIQGVISEYERAKMAERYRRGKLYRSRLGEVVSWRTPYAYRRVPRSTAGPAHLVVHEPEAAVVRRIFTQRVSDGLSLREIVRGLAADEIPSPTGKAMWGLSTLVRVLRNEAYIGYVYYNRTVSVPAPPGGKSRMLPRPRPREEWIPIQVPSIVTEEIFNAAQQVSVDNSRWSPRRTEPGTLMLRGLVKCGVCGVGTSCHRRRKRDGTCYRYYCCRNHDPIRAGGEHLRCRERSIRADELDELVFEEITKALLNPDLLLAGEQAVARRKELPDGDIVDDQLERLDRKIKSVATERQRVLDLYQGGLIDFADVQRRTGELDARALQLEKEQAALHSRREELLSGERIREMTDRFAKHVLQGLDRMDFNQRQQLLRLVVEEVRVTGWQVEIRLRIPLAEQTPPQTEAKMLKQAGNQEVSTNVSLRSLRDERMKVRVIPGALPESLPDDDDSGAHPLIQQALTVCQHGPVSGSTQVGEKRSVKAEVGPQHLRNCENDMMVRDSLQAVLGEPEGPLFCPPGLTGGTETSGLAGKRQQPLVAAFRAPNAGKTIPGITAIQELFDHPFGDKPQSPEGVLKLLFVHTQEGFPVILEESIEGIFRKTPRSIRHDRMSGGRVMGGGVSGEVHAK